MEVQEDEEDQEKTIDYRNFNQPTIVTEKPCEFQGFGNLCKQYAYREEENKDFRKYMEDYCFYSVDILKDKDEMKSFFGVMDGHGGKSAAVLASTELPAEFKKMWKEKICDVEDW